MWGARFTGSVEATMQKFNSSLSYDKRMYKEDIEGSRAYIKSLQNVNIVTSDEMNKIIEGLNDIETEWEEGKFEILPGDEDIHSANERRLKELIGSDISGKLHTGRSRNDQCAVDMRLWLMKNILNLKDLLKQLMTAFVNRADKEQDVILPGYTHLQRAQPIRWSHWLLGYLEMLKRDYERLSELETRVSVCPLGSGALAGNPFNIDREKLTQELNFLRTCDNSLDGTSDRDFVVEFLFWCSLTSVHLSRWAEDLIIYSTKEFNFITLSDLYSTGSSLMPQKKNPDSLELIRGKSGRVTGHCFGLLMTLKGLPSNYNKDLQEDKEAMFDAYDTMEGVLQVAAGVLNTLTVNKEVMSKAISPDMMATDIAYYLVRRGVPFRDAHGESGKLVKLAEEKKCTLDQLTIDDFKSVSDKFEDDVLRIFCSSTSTDQYTSHGGTSKQQVLDQINANNDYLNKLKSDPRVSNGGADVTAEQ